MRGSTCALPGFTKHGDKPNAYPSSAQCAQQVSMMSIINRHADQSRHSYGTAAVEDPSPFRLRVERIASRHSNVRSPA
jgi:hypothetical protein